jgi:hypothetical protein
MRAELKGIDPNDYKDWEDFVSSERPEPWDDSGWFSLDIGPEGEAGAEIFQVLVATPAAVSRAKGDRKGFRGIIVGEFNPEIIEKALRDYVSNTTGSSWPEIVEQLRHSLVWEYE